MSVKCACGCNPFCGCDCHVEAKAALLQVDEYRKFCEMLVGSVETDLTFWKRRAQFSLDAMEKPKCDHDWLDLAKEAFSTGLMCRKCHELSSYPEKRIPELPERRGRAEFGEGDV